MRINCRWTLVEATLNLKQELKADVFQIVKLVKQGDYTMTNFKTVLVDYENWYKKQDFADSSQTCVILKSPPTPEQLSDLKAKFKTLPDTYLNTLNDFGLSSYQCDIYMTRMLAPEEVIRFYDLVQDEMDFNDELRDDILEEDNLDFYRFIPVMAGEGTDGCWVLLNLDTGKVLLWDTDQPGDMDGMYDNLETFILDSIDSAQKGEPIRLT